MKTYHYGPSKSVFAGPDENPDNVAFCWPDGKAESCLGQGLLRVSACKKVRICLCVFVAHTVLVAVCVILNVCMWLLYACLVVVCMRV